MPYNLLTTISRLQDDHPYVMVNGLEHVYSHGFMSTIDSFCLTAFPALPWVLFIFFFSYYTNVRDKFQLHNTSTRKPSTLAP
jgi:hypothetical protein